MLTIPSTVEALFRTDGVRKNFRVHFPGGEMNDITNANVVMESVKFTESVCSQDVLRFGLTEASLIEFETVGVANMYGLTIECGIEIDTSSLSAAQISAIQAGTWDGTLVLAADSDLGWGFFRLPYGTFRVDSCPRNQQAMTHRRVKAYSLGLESKYAANPFELAKLALLLPGGGTYAPNAKCLFYSALFNNDAAAMASAGYTKTSITDPSQIRTLFTNSLTAKLTDNTQITLNYQGSVLDCGGVLSPSQMYSLDCHGFDYSEVLPGFEAYLESYHVDPVASGYSDMGMLITALTKGIYSPCAYYKSGNNWLDAVPVLQDSEAVFPYRPAGTALECHLMVPDTVEIWGTNIPTKTYSPATIGEWFSLTDSSTQTALDSAAVSFSATLQQNRSIGGSNTKCWSFVDAVPLLDFINGFLELMGVFGRSSRSGVTELSGLSSSSPVAIGPGDTEELWWDEYDVEPVGSVTYAFGSGEASEIVFGSGRSVYDLTDNAVLKALSGASTATVEAILSVALIPALAAVTYTPVELAIRALPWIEAGDALQITAEDNTVVDTVALNHVISGIQALFDDVEAKGGELVDSWED